MFCTKYRAKVLLRAICSSLQKILLSTAKEKGFIADAEEMLSSGGIQQLEANEEHVDLFVSAPPHVSISVLVKWIKGISARRLLQKHGYLKKRLYRGHLWNPSYYVGTVGDMSEEVVRRYIESQKSEAPKKAKT